MMAIVQIILGFMAVKLVARVLAAMGFAVFTYVGMGTALEWIEAEAHSVTNSLPADVIIYMAMMKVDICMAIYFAAMSYKITFMSAKRLAGVS